MSDTHTLYSTDLSARELRDQNAIILLQKYVMPTLNGRRCRRHRCFGLAGRRDAKRCQANNRGAIETDDIKTTTNERLSSFA